MEELLLSKDSMTMPTVAIALRLNWASAHKCNFLHWMSYMQYIILPVHRETACHRK